MLIISLNTLTCAASYWVPSAGSVHCWASPVVPPLLGSRSHHSSHPPYFPSCLAGCSSSRPCCSPCCRIPCWIAASGSVASAACQTCPPSCPHAAHNCRRSSDGSSCYYCYYHNYCGVMASDGGNTCHDHNGHDHRCDVCNDRERERLSLYIRLIIFPHIDNPQSTGHN